MIGTTTREAEFAGKHLPLYPAPSARNASIARAVFPIRPGRREPFSQARMVDGTIPEKRAKSLDRTLATLEGAHAL